MSKTIKLKLILIAVLFLVAPLVVSADTLGQEVVFNIDSSYDFQNREEVTTTLKIISQQGYFYIEDDWFKNLTEGEKKEVSSNLEILVKDFDNTIYPKLTTTYGSEWKPGIDNNYNVTIFFHKMKEGVGGYFNSGDEYPKIQNPKSNEREMVYLNADHLKSPLIKSYLAHEFTHLITFNQKEKLWGVSEEVWLNEARADFSPTLLGYDDEYQGSNLQQRVRQFISWPSDSLTEWKNEKADYGVVNLFSQYLIDHYGIKIFVDSLHSKEVGIASINQALKNNGFNQDFSQIFTDWLITLFLNDCNYGVSYCYKNEDLKNLRITPSLIFLPSTQKTDVFLNYSIKQWSGNWYRIIGGEGDLKLELDGDASVDFKLPYVLCKDTETCQINFLEVDKNQKGEIYLEDFKKNWSSLNLIPSIQSKLSGFGSREPLYPFSISVSTKIKTEEERLREKLIAQIMELTRQIEELKVQLKEILNKKLAEIPKDFKFKTNLSFGTSKIDVLYLRKILISDDCLSDFSDKFLFDSQTLEGVQCLCQKYKEEISQFAGYQVQCTGFVGTGIRTKLNQLISR